MHSSSASRKLNLRRVLATLLVALATVLACPAPSIAQTSPEGYEYEVELGGVVITGLPGASGKVEIPSSIQGLPVEGIDDGAFEFNHAITEVVIPDGVTSIGERAFNDCTSLTSVTLPGSLTSIGKSAFYSCASLAQVDLPEGLTELGDYAFFDCTSLTKLVVPGSVRSLGTAAFSECSQLEEVTIGSGVTTISERAFKECESLTDVTLADSVSTIARRAFERCLSLGSINLTHVTSIGGYAFSSCVLKDADLSSCEFIGEKAFESQSGLAVDKLDLSSLKTIERHAFYRCFGGEYDPSDTSEGSTIELPACLESIAGGAFAGTGVAYLEVDENCAAYKDVDGAVYTADGSTLVSVAPKYAPADGDDETFDVAEGTTSIGAYAFEDVRYITYIDMPDTVTKLGEGAFYGAVGKLDEVTLSESLTSIPNDAFHNCTIASITLPEGVTSIGEAAFANDGLDDNVSSNLRQMTVEGDLQSIGSYAFYNCELLEKLELPASVTDLDASAFAGCTALADLSFAEGSPYTAENHSILADDGTTLVATYGIAGSDYGTVTYEIPEGVTSVGKQALCGCPANHVVVPGTATTFGEQCIGYQYDGIGTVTWKPSIIIYGDKDDDGLIAYAKANCLCMLTSEPLSNYPAATLSVGDTATFDFEAAPAELVSYASSNNYVATVDENGTITAVGGGEADIFACVGLKGYSMHVTVDGAAVEDPYADYVKIDDQAGAEAFGTAYEQYNDGNYASDTTTPGLFLYTGNAYHAINAFLEPDQFKKIADGEYGAGEYDELEQVGKNVASEISQFKVQENVVVYSGCADDEFVLGNGGAKDMENVLNMVGKQITFKPITSTSVLIDVAENFKRESTGNLILEIYMPKDSTQGTYVGLHSMVQEEAELTLAPGTKFTVIDAGVRWFDDYGDKIMQRYMKLALVEDEDVDPDPEPEPDPEPTPDPDPTPDTPDEQPAGDDSSEQTNGTSDGTPATGDATVPVTGLAAAGLALLAISPRVRRD